MTTDAKFAAPPLPRVRRRRGAGLRHIPALDGVRGLAVAAVLVYHLGATWLPGGFLGVSLFFTLSGFLITNLVLAEADRNCSLALREFWLRRFRRLLPAALVAITLGVAVTLTVGTSDQLANLRGDVAGALGYVANWRFILNGSAYAAGYQEPSTLLHFWSLGIEEQFYVVFPFLAWWLVKRRAGRTTWLGVVAGLSAASVTALLILQRSGNVDRSYFGSDTRAVELLAGVGLAVLIRMNAPRRLLAAARRPALQPVLAIPIVGMVAFWAVSHQADLWLYRGGLWAVALTSVAVIVVAIMPSPVQRLLSWAPLCWLGRISYGVYLYHWPLFRWLTPARTGLSTWPLVVLRLALTFALALASFHLLEQPIRTRKVRLTRPVLAFGTPVVVLALLGLGQFAQTRVAAANIDLKHAQGLQLQASDLTPSSVVPTSTTKPIPPLTKVLFLGDSLVHQSLPGFTTAFAAEGITVAAVGGPGETLLGNRDKWLTDLRAKVAEFDPDVVILEGCCGFGNPKKDRYYKAPNGALLALDSPELFREWAAVTIDVTNAAGSRGALPMWVLAPPARTNGYYGPIEGRIDRVNNIYQALVSCQPQVGLVDWRILTGPGGVFAMDLPGADGTLVKVRNDDGLHFAPAGTAVIAKASIDAIRNRWLSNGGRYPGPVGVPATCPPQTLAG
jgi:peptidoglycan/LPS O-acetylase OafA/YrhL